MRYRAVLFDLDGTLVDDFPAYAQIMKKTLSKFKIKATVKDLRRTFPMSLGAALNCLNVSASQQMPFETEYLDQKAQLHVKPALFSGIIPMFNRLESTLLPALGIVTSGGNREIQALNRNFEFMKNVWVAVTADTLPERKPAPEPLITAVDQMGIPANQALYVGDAVTDMEAANNAKMDFGIAGWGADPKVHFSNFRYRFQRPQDILNLL